MALQPGRMIVELTSDEAEMVIYSLALRYKMAERLKTSGHTISPQAIMDVAHRIERTGELQLGWFKITNDWTRFKQWLYPIKRVVVSFYEKNTNPAPSDAAKGQV